MFPYQRAVIGTPEPPTSRPKLNRVGVLLAHEVGVNTSPTGRYRSTNPERVLDDARAAAAYGVTAGKAWEYNYMIGLDGSAFTQAGEYMGAHCLKYNPNSAGIIFLNALDVPANPDQCATWHQLRDHMIDIGTLAAEHTVAPHYRYRATSCPGLRAEPPGKPWNSPTGEGRLGDLITELAHRPTPPAPPSGDDMRPIVTTWAGEPWPILVGFDPATSQYTWRGIPGPEVDELIARGAAVDGRATPWPAVWKSAAWVKRLG